MFLKIHAQCSAASFYIDKHFPSHPRIDKSPNLQKILPNPRKFRKRGGGGDAHKCRRVICITRNLKDAKKFLTIFQNNFFRCLLYSAQQMCCTKKSKQIFPNMKLRGLTPSLYIHVSVSDVYILIMRI